jgi:hypothetical protein
VPKAFYRFQASVIGRNTGKQSSRSVVFASAYRAGETLKFEREGVEADYSHRTGILEKGILVPTNAPAWTTDRERLWNEVEAKENRRDAQLARELLVAFPSQLTGGQRVEVLTEFLSSQVVSLGMVADYAIHAPSMNGDERNHHAHVLLTMRPVDENGFGKKAREWNSPDMLKRWREAWADTLNRTFEKHRVTDAQGEIYRADHRSYEDQGLEREPGVHLGPAVAALERQGVRTERGDINREVYARNDQVQSLRRRAADLQAELLNLKLGLNQRRGLSFNESKHLQEKENRFNL